VAAAAAGEEVAQEHDHAQSYGDSFIGMLADGRFNGINPCHFLIANPAIESLTVLERDGETLAGFHSLFSSGISRGHHQCVGVLGQLNQIISNRSCLSVHMFRIGIGYLWRLDRNDVASLTRTG